ncbi:hypothetical protein JGH11_10610 [Dysgonomonas sp. Marseille-P4677]|uniref:hypothetical protein n=1 Tax=Dysgonomonas sp. Marseille-P4677 TaxID=2364790 RepID=UPI001913EBC7|nr:hypothetical protein [Dysgonomonas sp. Marseille-P4677]MBK5721323.1 hypothetical protein [Dysgonomonas sp. Marseille-P4677]
MNKFFVEITWYVSKNNLEERLHEKFKSWEHKIIGEDWKEKLDEDFQEVHTQYKSTKGRCKDAHLDINKVDYPNITYIEIGSSLRMNLILIRGEV